MNIEQLKTALAAKVAEARSLMNQVKDGATADQAAQLNKLLGEADTLKAQLAMAEQLAAHEGYLAEPAGTKAAHLGWRQGGPGEGDAPIDPKAWRELKVANPVTGREMRVRFQVPLTVQAKGYPDAFEAYVRKGLEFVGPQDRKTLTEGTDTAGGYLVPEDWQNEIIKKVAITAQIRALARKITTSRDQVRWPRVAYTTDDKYTSGVRLTWTGEVPSSSTVHRVTEPAFGTITIPVHTSMASLPLSNDLLEDAAFDVAGIGTDLMGEAFGLGEDDVFLSGDGVNKPIGILTRVDVGDVNEKIATVVTGSASTITADGLYDLFFGLPSQYRGRAIFVLNSGTAKIARKLKDGGATGRYLWDSMQAPNFGGLSSPAFQDTLVGRGVIYDEFMPDVGANTYPILWGDFSGYFIVDRVGLSIQRLSELYAETNITLLLGRKRVGAEVAQPFRFKVNKCSV